MRGDHVLRSEGRINVVKGYGCRCGYFCLSAGPESSMRNLPSMVIDPEANRRYSNTLIFQYRL